MELNEKLEENLNLPIVGGKIIAFFRRYDYFGALHDIYISKAKHNFRHRFLTLEKKQLEKKQKALETLSEIFPEEKDKILEKLDELSKNDKLPENSWSPIDPYIYEIVDEIYAAKPEKLFFADWTFYVKFAGPDRRHLDGSAFLSSNKVDILISDLENCQAKIKSLLMVEFEGDFSKIIREDNPKLEVFSENGEVGLKFWVQSQNFQYCKIIDSLNLETILKELRLVDAKAKKLTKTLEALSF